MDLSASLDWLPTFVEFAGGAKGNAPNEQIMADKQFRVGTVHLAGLETSHNK